MDTSGLQFSVLLSVAVRLASLLKFIALWGRRDRRELPLAWLRFQMDDGHDLFKVIVSAFLESLEEAGKTTVSGMSGMVALLWDEVRETLGLPLETLCPVVVDEAQILTKTRYSYSHVTDTPVRAP